MLYNIFLYAISFLLIWFGTGLTLKSVEKLSENLKISSFAVSFLILGFFTSISEFSVGINAILDNDPEIYVGNLIGASIVIFMMIVPLLAITGNKLKITEHFRGFNMIYSLIVIALPAIVVFDGKLDRTDSILLILAYTILAYFIERDKGLFESFKKFTPKHRTKLGSELGKIIIGIIIIFIASNIVVDQTIYFSNFLNISPFLLSLLIISLGTNVPELSFVVRSVFMKSNQVAFGDYVGSAACNTFLMGVLTLINGKTVYVSQSYAFSLIFLVFGLTAFYIFARSKNTISRNEGLLLLAIYIAFLLTEVITR